MSAAARLVTPQRVSLEDACSAWLATFCGPEQRSTRTAYGKAADALLKQFTCDVSELDADAVAKWFTRWYGEFTPATWNLRLNALRSAVAYWQRQGWIGHDPLVRLERRKPRADETRALGKVAVENLIEKRSLPLRDRLLICMLYETAARSAEILSLDVKDLDRKGHSAKVTGKGGKVRPVVWQSRTARLLESYLKECTACNGKGVAGWPVVTECAACGTTGTTSRRKRGPLFLTERVACVILAPCDIDPASGKARLSYRQAEAIFRKASGGKTLHQLRHSALTHDAESGTSTPMLMARSGHTSVRSLVRYARVSEDALKAHQQRTDPARRKAW